MTSKIDGASAPRPVTPPVAAAVAPAAVERSGSPRTQAITEALAASSDHVRLTGEAAALRVVQQQTKAGPPPMDMAKIDALRAVLAAGTYRIDPMEIAQRLDALERQLSI